MILVTMYLYVALMFLLAYERPTAYTLIVAAFWPATVLILVLLGFLWLNVAAWNNLRRMTK